MKPIVGQTVYRLIFARGLSEITEHIVTRVGSKYVECEGLPDKYLVEGLVRNNPVTADKLFLTLKQANEFYESRELISKIRKWSNGDEKKKLADLKKIAKILNL